MFSTARRKKGPFAGVKVGQLRCRAANRFLGHVERATPHPLSGQPAHCQSSVAVGFPRLRTAPPDHLGVSGAAAQPHGRLQPLAAPSGLSGPSKDIARTLRPL